MDSLLDKQEKGGLFSDLYSSKLCVTIHTSALTCNMKNNWHLSYLVLMCKSIVKVKEICTLFVRYLETLEI